MNSFNKKYFVKEVAKDDELILNQGTSNEIKIWGYKVRHIMLYQV